MVTNPLNIHVGDQECYVDFKEIQGSFLPNNMRYVTNE